MAKTSVINRQKKREALVARFAERRNQLRTVLRNPEASIEEKLAARIQLHKMPKDSSKVRLHFRCLLTGRPRGYYRRFKVSRMVFRKLAHQGELPGVRKASW